MRKSLTLQTVIKLLVAIFIGGYASLSLELIVLRQLSSFVGTTTITVSIIMGSFLAFMSMGYYQGSIAACNQKSIRREAEYGFLTIAALTVLSASYILMDLYFSFLTYCGITFNLLQTTIYALIFLSYGPYLFGKITAMVSRYLHYRDHNYTGKIMAVDTLGSVMGSLLTSLITMPFIGVNYSILVLVIICIIGAMLFVRRFQYHYLAIFLTLMSAYLFNQDKLLNDIYNIVENNAVSTISIHDVDDGKSKIMSINRAMSSKVSKIHNLNFAYINFINDNFINTIPKESKKDILVIGAGGFTVGLEDKSNNYIYVDVDKDLKKITEEMFLMKKLDANKKFIVQDANQFLKESKQKYDVIVLDTYSSKSYIPQDLVTKEYFTRAKHNLKDGGVLLLNTIVSPSFSDDFSMNLDNTLRQVFSHNLRSQVINGFNAWQKDKRSNVIYIYYHHENPNSIYSLNKNISFYDYEMSGI